MSVSEVEEDYEVKVEIQKLLGRINDDMNKLKNEVVALNTLIEDNASLPSTIKLVNDKLIMAAKEIGVDLRNIGSIQNIDDLEEQSNNEQSDNERLTSTSNAAAVAVATEKLAEKMKRTLK